MRNIILGLFLFIWSARAATISLTLLNDGAFVPPSSSMIAEFRNRGNDVVHVVINGVDMGDIVYPYQVTYTSLPIGQVNSFVVTTCDYMGRTSVLNFTTLSQGRTYNKHRN